MSPAVSPATGNHAGMSRHQQGFNLSLICCSGSISIHPLVLQLGFWPWPGCQFINVPASIWFSGLLLVFLSLSSPSRLSNSPAYGCQFVANAKTEVSVLCLATLFLQDDDALITIHQDDALSTISQTMLSTPPTSLLVGKFGSAQPPFTLSLCIQ